MKQGVLPTKGLDRIGGQQDALRKAFMGNLGNFNNAVSQFRRRQAQENARRAREDARALAAAMKAREQGFGDSGLRFSSAGRFAQSAFIKGFGGGFGGALVGVIGLELISAIGRVIGTVGRKIGDILASSIQTGIDFSRLETSLKFLAQSGPRATSWMQQMVELSAGSGFGINQLGSVFQNIAGQTTDLEQVPAIMRAITEISAGLGADAEKMQRFALAIGQVAAAGRFEGQEILQLTEVLPIKHFADTAGVSIGEFRKRMKEGTLSVDILWQTLNRLALSPGGAFFGRLEKQADTAVGQVMQMNQQWMLFKASMGKGLLEELKDQGVLSAINHGLKFLLDNKDQVRAFMAELVSGLKEAAIVSARWAGILYDLFAMLFRNRKLIHFMVAPVTSIISENISAGTPGFQSDTSEKLARQTAEWFKKEFVPVAQSAVDQIRISPKLASDVEQMAMGISKKFREGGGSPFAEFVTSMKQIGEAEKFFPADRYRKMADAIREMNEAERLRRKALGEGKFEDMNTFLNQKNQAREKLENLQAMGNLFGQQEADFGRAEAFLRLEESMDNLANRVNELPTAMTAGSVEAASTINKAIMRDERRKESIQERIERVMKATKDQDKKRNEMLREIERHLRPKPTLFGMRIGG